MAHSAHRPNPSLVGKAAIVMLALALTACGTPSDSASPPSPTPARAVPAAPRTVAPTPAAEPSTQVSTHPSTETWEVIERFFDAYTYGLNTGDSAPLQELSTSECASCVNLIKDVDDLKSRETVSTGGAFSFSASRGVKTRADNHFVWHTTFSHEPIHYRDLNSGETKTASSSSADIYIELSLDTRGWRVSGISDSLSESR